MANFHNMYGDLFFILTILLGFTYIYCLFRAHFFMVKLDRLTNVPRSKCGEIREQDLLLLKGSAIAEYATDAQTALLNLQVSNIIAVLYLTGAIAFICILGFQK
jgi:hypothetical protein